MLVTRRVVAAVALSLTVALAAAGCSKSETPATTTSPPATTSGTAAGAGGKSTSAASKAELEAYQKDLNAVGCWAGPVDGVDGPKTEAAIKEFQAAAGLTVDGKLGPQTEAALAKDAKAGKIICVAKPGTTHAGSGTTAKPSGNVTTPTTNPSVGCPPNCNGQITANPTSGKAGSTVMLRTPGDNCTGPVTFTGPGTNVSAAPAWSPGAGNSEMSFTVPASAQPGSYTFTGSCGATAAFTVTA